MGNWGRSSGRTQSALHGYKRAYNHPEFPGKGTVRYNQLSGHLCAGRCIVLDDTDCLFFFYFNLAPVIVLSPEHVAIFIRDSITTKRVILEVV